MSFKSLINKIFQKNNTDRLTDVANRIKASPWDPKLHRMSTSVSDNEIYPDFCAKASIYSDIFINFRTNDIYKNILEHVTQSTGEAYLNQIKKLSSDYFKHFEKFKENDLWGNPETFEYPELGTISPSTLRYIKVYYDLQNLFGSMDGLKICEVGVGYGGQCRIINSVDKPVEYTLVDLKPCLNLAQRYLDNYILSSKVRYLTMNELDKEEYDLFISNYAFTEVLRDIQAVYLNKIVLSSSKGYITYNKMPLELGFNCYTSEELVSMIPGSEIIDETPNSPGHPDNCVIIWGHKNVISGKKIINNV